MGICAVSHDLAIYEREQDRLEALTMQEEQLAKEIEEALLGDRIGEVIAEIMGDNSDELVKQLEKLHVAVTDEDQLKVADAIRYQLKDLAGMMAEEEADKVMYGDG